MLPTTLSQSAQSRLATGSHMLYRVMLSPATARALGATAAIKLSPRLSAHSRSCWGWSRRYDRDTARAQLAQARTAHKIVRAKLIRDASMPAASLFKSKIHGSQLSWRSSSSWNNKDHRADGLSGSKIDKDSNKLHESDRYNDDLFALSDREKAWRAKSDALRKWIEENPYEALFGYSNRLGRFERGGLFASISRWTSLEPADSKPAADAKQSKPPSQHQTTRPNEVQNSLKPNVPEPRIPVPAKPTKMGHASSTPRTSTILSEAELVYDPISNRMVRSGSGEFSHYAQELDVGAKSSASSPMPQTSAPSAHNSHGAAEARAKLTPSTSDDISISEEYAKYKSKRLAPQQSDASWLAKEGFSPERDMGKTPSSKLNNERREQIARRAKLERNFDSAQMSEPGRIDLPPRRMQLNTDGTTSTQNAAASRPLVDTDDSETALDRHLARKARVSKKIQSSLDRHSRSWYPRHESTIKVEARQAIVLPKPPSFDDYLAVLNESGGARGKLEKGQVQPSPSIGTDSTVDSAKGPGFDDYLNALSEAGAARDVSKSPRSQKVATIKAKSAAHSSQQPDFEDYMNALNEAGGARRVPKATVQHMIPRIAEQQPVQSYQAPGFEHYLEALSKAGAARKPTAAAQLLRKVASGTSAPPMTKEASIETDEVEFASMDEPFVIEPTKKLNNVISKERSGTAAIARVDSVPVKPNVSCTYTVLAYDQMTNQVTSAEMAAPSSSTEAVTPLSTALMQLKEPAKFLPHLEKIKGRGFEVVSCGDNLLILKRNVEIPDFEDMIGAQVGTSGVSGSSTKAAAYIPTGDLASPTSFIHQNNHDALPEGAPPKPTKAIEDTTQSTNPASESPDSAQPSLSGFPRSKHNGPFRPRRVEPVFSGGKYHRRSADWKHHSRRPRRFWGFVKRVAVTFGFTAALLYVAGLIMQMRRASNEGRMVWNEPRSDRRAAVVDEGKARE